MNTTSYDMYCTNNNNQVGLHSLFIRDQAIFKAKGVHYASNENGNNTGSSVFYGPNLCTYVLVYIHVHMYG